MLIIVLGRHVSILTESSSGPSKKIDPYLVMFKGPEDDSVRIETCRPSTIINIINFYFISVFNQVDAQNLFHNKFYFMPLHVSSTVVLIIRRSKLNYTASGIITPIGGSTATYRA